MPILLSPVSPPVHEVARNSRTLTRAVYLPSSFIKCQAPQFTSSRLLSSGGEDPPGWDNGQGGKNGGQIMSGGTGKDTKGGKGGGGVQWSCPKCGNACTVLERKEC